MDDQSFSANLAGFIDGDWIDLVRYDTAHGGTHRHIFYPDGTVEVMPFVAVLPVTFAAWVQRDLQEHAEAYYNEFARRLGNMRRDDDS